MRGILETGAIALLTIGAAGCTDRIPTFSGADPFPGGGTPATLEQVFETSAFLIDADVYAGRTTILDARFHLLANQFDSALSSNLLATLVGFPDTIHVGTEPDSDFTYLESQLVGIISDTLTASEPDLAFQLWEVAEPWDTAAVSWENRIDSPGQSASWAQPGGTRGALIDVARWSAADTAAAADSLVWQIPPEVMERLAAGEIPGLLVTLQDAGTRVNISRLGLRARIRPSDHPDVVATRPISRGSQRVVYTPDIPEANDVLRVGGIRSDRSILRITLPETLPGCADASNCAPLRGETASLNRVELLLDPLPVPAGYRPFLPIEVTMRSLLEPELGSRSPLGGGIFRDSIAPERFGPSSQEPVSFFITGPVIQAYADEEDELAVALLVEPEASTFGFAWFDRTPRLRFVYTVRQTPQLP
ncbi:MAG: hypothetical protein WD737_00665 [Gemmatimonadota bacterium]